MCEFQSLQYDDEGYVIRCKQCGFYQVAFISTMLTLTEHEFQLLLIQLKRNSADAVNASCTERKNVIIKTPSPEVCMVLTQKEAINFYELLNAADNEAKAISMLNLFNPG